jgi:hypothetical protein
MENVAITYYSNMGTDGDKKGTKMIHLDWERMMIVHRAMRPDGAIGDPTSSIKLNRNPPSS